MKKLVLIPTAFGFGLFGTLGVVSTQLMAQDHDIMPEKPPGNQNSFNSYLTPAQKVYSRDEILQSSVQNTADFIRNLPINSFGSLRPETSHVNQSDENVSLRGLNCEFNTNDFPFVVQVAMPTGDKSTLQG